MPSCVDQLGFADGIASPEEEHDTLTILRESLDGRIGELLPPLVLMRAGLVRPHGEGGVEQQHPLVGPTAEVARGGGDVDGEVGVDLLDDID